MMSEIRHVPRYVGRGEGRISFPEVPRPLGPVHYVTEPENFLEVLGEKTSVMLQYSWFPDLLRLRHRKQSSGCDHCD